MTAARHTQSQVPAAGTHNVDHVAYFVPDRDRMHEALVRLGFSPTPFSLQQHRVEPGAALVPAGTGNHCVMLREGYLEFLVPLAATALAEQMRRAIGRYVGAHSIVFGTADIDADAKRLGARGFGPLPIIDLQRRIGTVSGEQTARFTVLRVPAGTMPEGRIQFCRHHTPELVWQPRWTEHANGAVRLAGVLVCVADIAEAAARFGQFIGVEPICTEEGCELQTARGAVRFVRPDRCAQVAGMQPPALPWIIGCEIASEDLSATVRVLAGNGIEASPAGRGRVRVDAPGDVGGALFFTECNPAR